MFPLWLMRWGLAKASAQNRPAILYFHPWEFDPGMPRMPMPIKNRIRTYVGLRSAKSRLGRIMAQPARWSPIAEALPEMRSAASAQPVFCLNPRA